MQLGIRPDFIIEHTSIYLGTCKRAVMSKIRTGEIAEARHIAMHLSYKMFRSNYTELSEWFDKTIWGVRYGVENVAAIRSVDKEFNRKLEMVERHLIAQKITELAKYDIQFELVSETNNLIL